MGLDIFEVYDAYIQIEDDKRMKSGAKTTRRMTNPPPPKEWKKSISFEALETSKENIYSFENKLYHCL